ncbi:MAG: uroporphyrinogen-III C-methyltransferase [Planctomycetes bacterium]|nr:uroporphyrinogen-III C-methyltransferase [Planctomycetota bacterium]
MRADVVLYDRLVDPRLLDLPVSPRCEKIYVGKEMPGRESREKQQAHINELMVERARGGKRVVRLKGGDPYIFGRGAEEGFYLASHGIPFEVVPGVTAALGAAAATGIPFTHRGIAGEVTFATAHEADGTAAPPWEALGKLRGTVVFYMGTYTLAHAAEKLIEAGRKADTPVAVVERATTARQRTVVGTLGTIAKAVAEAGVKPPSLVIVGDVVGLRPPLNWFEKRPLFGRRVLLTRPRSGAVKAELEDAGAEVGVLPCLEFRPPGSWQAVDAALRKLGSYDWVVLTSGTTIGYVGERFEKLGLDARAFGKAKVAAIGDNTAFMLRCAMNFLVRADLVPKASHAEGLVAALGPKKIRGKKFLLLRADKGREALPELLKKAGAKVDDVAVYRSVAPKPDPEAVAELAKGAWHAAVLTSGEIARNLHAFLGNQPWPASTKLVTIGPVTSAAVRELGWPVDVEAASPGRLADAVLEALAGK